MSTAIQIIYHVYNPDKLTCAGYLVNLADIKHMPHYTFVKRAIVDTAFVTNQARHEVCYTNDASKIMHKVGCKSSLPFEEGPGKNSRLVAGWKMFV